MVGFFEDLHGVVNGYIGTKFFQLPSNLDQTSDISSGYGVGAGGGKIFCFAPAKKVSCFGMLEVVGSG